jgi:hypothetical protein
MLKRLLVVALVVAGCQPEAFHGELAGAGGSPGGNGPTGVAGAGVLPVMVPGTAGDGAQATGVAGTGGPAGTGALAGAAGMGAAGAGPGAAGSNAGGAAGDMSAVTGTGGATGAAGDTAGTIDAGGRTTGDDAGPRDAAPEAQASVPYVSTNWKPTASITAAGTANPPADAFDGKITTRWTTGRNQMGNEWFMVDLGQVEPVSRVVLDDTTNPQDFPAAYTLELSTNGTMFTPVKMGKGATITDIQFATVDARYVRILQTGTTPAGGSWWSIDELRIYP